MSYFFRVFVPIILLGVAVVCIIIKVVKLRADKEKYKGDYAAEGMFMGMCFGLLIGITLDPKNGLSLGLSIGTLIGLCIGTLTHKK